MEGVTLLARFAYSFADFKIEKFHLSRRKVILSPLPKFPYFTTGARGTDFCVAPTFFNFRFLYIFVFSIKFPYVLFHLFFLYISWSCWYIYTTGARGTELTPPFFLLSVCIYIFNKISLLFHLFFLISTCSCQYSYNLILTATYMFRSYILIIHKLLLLKKCLLKINMYKQKVRKIGREGVIPCHDRLW